MRPAKANQQPGGMSCSSLILQYYAITCQRSEEYLRHLPLPFYTPMQLLEILAKYIVQVHLENKVELYLKKKVS